MRKALFFILSVFVFVATNAQQLNSDGLKMVSKIIRIKKVYNATIEFSYDYNKKLKKIDYVLIKNSVNGDVSRDIVTRNGNNITQKTYLNGKPTSRYEYKYDVNSYCKIEKFVVTEYCALNYIWYLYNYFVYKNGKIQEIIRGTSWDDNKGDGICYNPGSWGTRFFYDDKGWYVQNISYDLTEEQKRKYAPLFTKAEYEECKDDFRVSEHEIKYKNTVYSDTKVNDTNIGLNGLFEGLSSIYDGGHGQKMGNILFYTEWVGLREDKLPEKRKPSSWGYSDIEYKYDSNGNIIEIVEWYKGEVNCTLKIEYVY